MKYAAILIDLDGTLADTAVWHRVSLEIAMATVGGHGLFVGDAERRSIDQIEEHLADCRCTRAGPASVESLYWAKWRAMRVLLIDARQIRQGEMDGDSGRWYTDRTAQPSAVMARAIDVNRDRCLIVTDSPDFVARPLLWAEIGRGDLPFLARATPNALGKMPDGVLYRDALTQLGVEAKDAVVIEDDPRAIESARNLGLAVRRVTGPADAVAVLRELLEVSI